MRNTATLNFDFVASAKVDSGRTLSRMTRQFAFSFRNALAVLHVG